MVHHITEHDDIGHHKVMEHNQYTEEFRDTDQQQASYLQSSPALINMLKDVKSILIKISEITGNSTTEEVLPTDDQTNHFVETKDNSCENSTYERKCGPKQESIVAEITPTLIRSKAKIIQSVHAITCRRNKHLVNPTKKVKYSFCPEVLTRQNLGDSSNIVDSDEVYYCNDRNHAFGHEQEFQQHNITEFHVSKRNPKLFIDQRRLVVPDTDCHTDYTPERTCFPNEPQEKSSIPKKKSRRVYTFNARKPLKNTVFEDKKTLVKKDKKSTVHKDKKITVHKDKKTLVKKDKKSTVHKDKKTLVKKDKKSTVHKDKKTLVKKDKKNTVHKDKKVTGDQFITDLNRRITSHSFKCNQSFETFTNHNDVNQHFLSHEVQRNQQNKDVINVEFRPEIVSPVPDLPTTDEKKSVPNVYQCLKRKMNQCRSEPAYFQITEQPKRDIEQDKRRNNSKQSSKTKEFFGYKSNVVEHHQIKDQEFAGVCNRLKHSSNPADNTNSDPLHALEDEENYFNCLNCNLNFLNRTEFFFHKRTKYHAKRGGCDPLLWCHKCDWQFADKYRLEVHNSICHSNNKPATYVRQLTSIPPILITYVPTETITTFKIPVLKMTYSTSVMKHEELTPKDTQGNQESSNIASSLRNIKIVRNNFRCWLCPEVFSNSNSLDQHLTSHVATTSVKDALYKK